MVTVIRSGAIAPGKTADALAFAHQMKKLIKEKYGIAINCFFRSAEIRPGLRSNRTTRIWVNGRLSRRSSWPMPSTWRQSRAIAPPSCPDR